MFIRITMVNEQETVLEKTFQNISEDYDPVCHRTLTVYFTAQYTMVFSQFFLPGDGADLKWPTSLCIMWCIMLRDANIFVIHHSKCKLYILVG